MKYEYTAEFSINLGKAIPEVGGLLDKLNTHIADMGYDEQKIQARSKFQTATVTADRILTNEEENTMSQMLESQIRIALPEYDIRLTLFRRKSGNVEQSVA